jgi:polyferredoxin
MQDSRPMRPWPGTIIYGGLLLALFVVTPFTGTLMHVKGFVPKIIATIAGGLMTNTAITLLFITLFELWMRST